MPSPTLPLPLPMFYVWKRRNRKTKYEDERINEKHIHTCTTHQHQHHLHHDVRTTMLFPLQKWLECLHKSSDFVNEWDRGYHMPHCIAGLKSVCWNGAACVYHCKRGAYFTTNAHLHVSNIVCWLRSVPIRDDGWWWIMCSSEIHCNLGYLIRVVFSVLCELSPNQIWASWNVGSEKNGILDARVWSTKSKNAIASVCWHVCGNNFECHRSLFTLF